MSEAPEAIMVNRHTGHRARLIVGETVDIEILSGPEAGWIERGLSDDGIQLIDDNWELESVW